jgi:bifunctional UDP-N-acetylglucosamine pyrophosphorylase/glucosamine-1-phosphate N-acetyltransferase
MTESCEAVVLAAGLGTRMRSSLAKVLHPLGGRPMLLWSVDACRDATGRTPYVVVGPEAEDVRQMVGERARFVEQGERLGTGHAVLQARELLRGQSDLVLVTSADMPLLLADTYTRLIDIQRAHEGPLTLLVQRSEVSRGFGRVMRQADGRITGVVEEAHATPEQRAISELNSSVYCFQAAWLWEQLPRLAVSPKGEYYLTDLVGMAADQGGAVAWLHTDDPDELIGINTREHLAEAEAALRRRINRRWMLAGVTLTDPATTYIGPEVELGSDTVVLPNTCLEGKSVAGTACRIGPNAILRDTSLGNGCRVEASVLEGAVLEDGADVGPFSHLRRGAHLMEGVHVGNFGEIKNSTLGPGTKMGHFSYIGDATIGANVNIGAGTITCNFGRDGEKQHTHIGDDAFIGSDTLLVAPVRVGKGAVTGAGSVVTKDVPDSSLAVGVPARVISKWENNE